MLATMKALMLLPILAKVAAFRGIAPGVSRAISLAAITRSSVSKDVSNNFRAVFKDDEKSLWHNIPLNDGEIYQFNDEIRKYDDGFKEGYGAYTGEINGKNLADYGVKWTLIGHSERRADGGEMAIKTKNAIDSGFSVIFCTGEHLAELGEVNRQLSEADWKKIVIAYEPLWAEKGSAPSPQQIQETHADIRYWLCDQISPEIAAGMRIIYGGSTSNIDFDELYAMDDINGFLIAGASLKEEFVKIVSGVLSYLIISPVAI